MQRFILFIVFCGIAQAGAIDFGDLAGNATYNLCGDGQNIGSYYASQGVANIGGSLGDPVNSLDTDCRVSLGIDAAYPPIGSDINLISQDDFATIQFTSLVSSVSLEYVAFDPIELTAYDGLGDQLAQSTGLANTDGIDDGFDSPIAVSTPGIAYVTLGNVGLMDEYTFDDLSFTPQAAATPEPGSSPLLLTCLVGFGAWVLFRGAPRRPQHLSGTWKLS
jgi:hypothetical protein